MSSEAAGVAGAPRAGGAAVWAPYQVRLELRDALRELASRGLKKAGSWVAENLAGIGESFVVRRDSYAGKDKEGEPGARGGRAGSGGGSGSLLSSAIHRSARGSDALFPESAPETDSFLVAKAFYDCDEFERCAHLLSPDGTCPTSGNEKEIFLWAWAL
jgi:hypothetical protein